MLLNPLTVTGTETVVWLGQLSILGTEKLTCAVSTPIPTKKPKTVKGKVLNIFFEFIGLQPICSASIGFNLNRLSEKSDFIKASDCHNYLKSYVKLRTN